MVLMRAFAGAMLGLVLLASGSLEAWADDLVSVDTSNPSSGGGAGVILRPTDPGSGGGTSDAGSGPDATGAVSRTCTYQGVEIDCTSATGVWSEDRQCFVQRLPIDVSEEDPFQGHTDGAVYRCSTPGRPAADGSG